MWETISSFSRLMQLVALTLYTALVGTLLVYFDASVLVVLLFLSVLPLLLLWRLERLSTRVLPIIAGIALGAAVLFEATAYINGLWYELSPSEFRAFGLFPVEALVASVTHLLYLIVAYEYFMDDGGSPKRANTRNNIWIIGGISLVLVSALSYVYLFSSVVVSFSFAWLLFLITVLGSVAVAVRHRGWLRVVKKTALFASVIYPISLVYEYVALTNNLRFFANPDQYLFSVQLFGQPLPIEELLFLWLVPFWLATIYELYVDDGK